MHNVCVCTIHQNMKIIKLKSHHFINKEQSGFLKKEKEQLYEEIAIILMDFAENYSFKI